jgi:hypothetical protein
MDLVVNGLLCVFLMGEVYKFGKKAQKQPLASQKLSVFEPKLTRKELEQRISLDSLAELIQSNNLLLKRSALQILIDRGVSDAYLPDILAACQSEDMELEWKGYNALTLLAKSNLYREKLIQHHVLKIVNQTLMKTEDVALLKLLIIILYYLSHENADAKRIMAQQGTTKYLLNILQYTPSKTGDLVYWALVVIDQMALIYDIRFYLNKDNAPRVFMSVARIASGNRSVEKLCYHSIIRLINSMPPKGILKNPRKKRVCSSFLLKDFRSIE